MVKLKFWKIVFTFYQTLCGISASASTHWVVTENGLIQPLMDSPYHMRLPNDLMAFLEQEARLIEIDSLYHNLVSKKIVLDEATLEVPPDIFSKLYKTNDNCLNSGVAMSDIDLYMSIQSDGSDREGIKLVDFFADSSHMNVEGTDVPDCMQISPLPFSMFAFEHLKAMIGRHNISLAAEHSLNEKLPPGTSIASFGHQITLGLRHNSTSWLHYNLAAIFWRMKGEALQALECERRAVHYAPRQYRDVALLNLASIFHQTKNSGEAAIILHAAIDHAPRQPINHFALGNVYAVLEDYNRSAACFDNCLKLMPSHKEARTNKQSVVCHEKYVNELIELHDAIQSKRTELHDFQTQHEKWLRLGEKAMREQAPLEARILGLSTDPQSVMTGNGHTCVQKPSSDPKTPASFSCQLNNPTLMYNVAESRHEKFNPFDIMLSLQMLLKNVEAETKKLSLQIARTEKFHLLKKHKDFEYSMINMKKIHGDNLDSGVFEDDVVDLSESSVSSSSFYPNEDPIETQNDEPVIPVSKPRYPPTMKITRIKEDFDRNSDWPSRKECDDWAPSLAKRIDKEGEPLESLSVYLPLENKGYNVKAILSDLIGVPLNEEHPLPWYPPLCCAASQLPISSSYLPSSMLSKPKPLPNLPTDNMLRNVLISYVTNYQVDSIKNVQEAEIGQRILTAIKNKTASKWLLYTLASLYWRVRGNSQNSLDCIVCALANAPSHLKDVPLVSLGSILHQLGFEEESLKAAAEALEINKIEPATNFLMSMLYVKKKNIIGQMYHMKQAVRVDFGFMENWAITLLKAWHCHAKFVNSNKEKTEDIVRNEMPEMCSDMSMGEKAFGGMGVSDVGLTQSLDGNGVVGRGMICTAGGQSCQPANIHCYKADTHSDLGEEYLPFDLIGDKITSDGLSEEILFQSFLSKVGKKDFDVFMKENAISQSDIEALYSKRDAKNLQANQNNGRKTIPVTRTKGKIVHSGKPNSKFENKGTRTSEENHNFDKRSKRDSSDSANNEAFVERDVNKHFLVHLAPTDADIEDGDSELGNLIISANQADITTAETLHVYDKAISYHLSSETCGQQTRPDWIKSPSLWDAFAQRDFFPSSELLSVIKYPVTDSQLKPQCSTPSGDLLEKSVVKGTIPPLPHQSSPVLLPILRRLTGDHDSPLNVLAAKIAEAIRHNTTSWILHVLAGIYWRIEGNSDMLVACLRQSLHLAPEKHKDVPLLGLSGVFHWLGMTGDALKLTNIAYKKRPDFPVNPYHLGLLHADLGEYEQSIHMFRKAIALDNSFLAAQNCLQDILCLLLFGNSEFINENVLVEEVYH